MSLRKSINNECKSCSHCPGAEGTWKEQVKNCQGESCNLYEVRPLPSGFKHDSKVSLRDSVNEHCKACIYDPQEKGCGSWREQVSNCPKTDCELYDVRPLSIKAKKNLKSNNIEIKEL